MPLILPNPPIYGHRGAAEYAPENTIAGIHAAADSGAQAVEADVKLTKDGVPIMFHDATLERTTNGSGNVADKTYAEIQELSAGYFERFGDGFADTGIPTLEAYIETLIELDMGFNMEIKPCPGRERETAEAALDILSRYWDDHDRLLISSFSHVALEAALEMAPDWHRGFLLPTEWPENWQDMVKYLRPSTININGNTVTGEQVSALKDAFNLPVLAYTVNEPERARLLQGWGVDGFFSDAPDILLDAGLFTLH
jgi:glycerophosphoryl diester phosphodiesterase